MSKEQDFQTIFEENYDMVIRLCLGYVRGREDLAKDLAQETFIKIWQHLDSFRNEAKITTWIYRITVNTCLQEQRKKKIKHLEIEVAGEEPDGPDNSENRFRKMYRCINKLSAENESIILLELENLPQVEIAEIIGISHQAVRTRINRIKNQLAKCVSDEEF